MEKSPKLSAITLAITNNHSFNSTKSFVLACLLFSSTSVYAGVQTPENTKWIGESLTQEFRDTFEITAEQYDPEGFGSLRFGVTDSNIWGANQSSTSIDYSLSSSQWNSVFGRPPTARLGVGGIAEVCIPVVGCAKAGAAAGIELETYVLPYLQLEFDPGTFDAKVEYRPSVVYQSEGLGTDFTQLNTKSNLIGSQSEFKLDAPSLFIETGVNIEANINLFAEACLLGCFLDETFNLYKTDFKVPLLRLDTGSGKEPGSEAEFIVFNPNPEGVLANIGDLIANPGAELIETFKDVLYTDATPLLLGTAEDKLSSKLSDENKQRWDDAKDALSSTPIEIAFSSPYAQDEGETVSFSNGVASDSIGGELLSIALDVDQVLGYAFGLTDGAKFSLDQFGVDTGPVTGSIELGDIKVGPIIELQTDVSLIPELMVNLEFDSEVRIRGQIGTQTSYSGTWENMPEIGLTAESNIIEEGQTAAEKTVSATATFSVDANVSNRTYLDLKAKADISFLTVEVDIEGDGLPGLEFGPVLTFEATSDSLYQIDLFNDTFAVNDWKILATNNGIESELSQESIVGSKVLTFNAFGEIVFQARSEGDSTDFYYDNDKRINVNLTTADVLQGQRDTHSEALYKGLYGPYIHWLLEEQLITRIQSELKIENQTAGHVFEDGLFSNNSDKTLTVESGGSLELGKQNKFVVRSLKSVGLDLDDNPVDSGVKNYGSLQIFGDVYSNAGVQSKGHKFINESSASLLVGAGGWLKFDGKFENEGSVDNAGVVELTALNNKSSGEFINNYGGEVDLYGALSLARQQSESLDNNGTFRVFSGGELEVERIAGRVSPNTNAVDIMNKGELFIDAGGELRMKQSAANSTGNGQAAKLSNVGTVSNSGYVLNESGQRINNGNGNIDFSKLVGADGNWKNSEAVLVRNSKLAQLEEKQKAFLDVNADMETIAQENRNDRVRWITSGTSSFDNRVNKIKDYAESTQQLVDYRKSGGTLSQASDAVKSIVTAITDDGFGVWENNSGSLLINEGNFENNAVMVNHIDANTYNSGLLDNSGYLLNAGQLINNKGTNQSPAEIFNEGRLENGTKQIGLANLSQTTNLGRIENRGELINHDTLVNYGSINSVNDGSGKTASTHIENNGTLANLGQLITAAQMTNAQGAQVDNYGTIQNTGVIDNHGFFNNGVQGSNAGQSDIAAQAGAAQDFYAAIQALQNDNQALQNVNQKYENELARQSKNGFKGTVEPSSAEAWAIHLYEKYLVSNLAGNEYSDDYGPNTGSLSKDRAAIRQWVISESGNAATIEGCATSLLVCYKAYYGLRKGDVSALNYDFSNSTNDNFVDDNTAIQHFTMRNDSGYFENNQAAQSDENRFEWTMLMMMEAEGIQIGALDYIRNNDQAGQSEGLNGNIQSTRKSFYSSYGIGFVGNSNPDRDFVAGDLNGLEALYARWVDEVFFETKAYAQDGQNLSLKDVGAYGSPATELVNLYKEMYNEENQYGRQSGLIENIQKQLSSLPESDFGALFAALSDPSNINVELLINALGSVLVSPNFDLAAITSLDANLENSGTFNNRGVVNNTAIISNKADGVINNSGVLMVGTTGSIENDGTLNLESYDVNTVDPITLAIITQQQEGLLVSNGIINNRGLIDISAGTLVNGTTIKTSADGPVLLVNPITTITNDGSIKLSGQSKVEDGKLIVSNAVLINNATIVNNGLIEIGAEDSFKIYNESNEFLGNLYSGNTLRNQGELINQSGGTLSNNGILYNAGLIDNQAGSTFTSAGLLNNTESGKINFAENATIAGALINNGLIDMADGEILTLTGNISGNGTFAGDTLIKGGVDAEGNYTASVNPGNSPGLLTFDGDVEAENVNWVMEIWGTERGVSYDAIDINGDFTIAGGMSLSILSLLDFDTLISQEFNLFSITGDLFDTAGSIITSTFEFLDFSDEMDDNWAGSWINDITGGWSLNLAFVGENANLYDDLRASVGLSNSPTNPTSVPEPSTLIIFISGLVFLLRRKKVSSK
jgi:hypothetical protein